MGFGIDINEIARKILVGIENAFEEYMPLFIAVIFGTCLALLDINKTLRVIVVWFGLMATISRVMKAKHRDG
jgi:uncharacterized membrane protein YecN with MAPEG domain